jgi:hypothetical protein
MIMQFHLSAYLRAAFIMHEIHILLNNRREYRRMSCTMRVFGLIPNKQYRTFFSVLLIARIRNIVPNISAEFHQPIHYS